MTNKQIAERLYLSPRTVGGHLYQIFPKLGITTRAALRDALGTADTSLVRSVTGCQIRVSGTRRGEQRSSDSVPLRFGIPIAGDAARRVI